MNTSATVVGTMTVVVVVVVVRFPLVIIDVCPVNDGVPVAAILVLIIDPVVVISVFDVAEAVPKKAERVRWISSGRRVNIEQHVG